MQKHSARLSRNNLDLLRLLFAGTVCLVHAYVLSGQPQLAWIARSLSATVAVEAFFVVSGFLIVMSFERSSTLASYAGKRVRRIYPAYAAVVLLSAVGLFLLSSKGTQEYFSVAWWRYIAVNLAFLNFVQPSLPGVFESNPITAVNGALWTLKIEVMFYIVVPLIVALVRRFGPFLALVSLYGLSILYAMFFGELARRTGTAVYAELARQLPGQLCYFTAGAFIYYFLPVFERKTGWIVIPAVLVLYLDTIHPLPALEPIALAAVVIFFGLFLYVGNFGKYGDFSYGAYIVHFPIIQTMVALGVFSDQPALYLLTVTLLTGLGAVATWHLVEKHFLLRSAHYVAVTEPAPASVAEQAIQ